MPLTSPKLVYMNVINFYIHSSHKLYNNYNLDIGGVCIRGYNNTAKFMEQDCCDAVISHLKLKGASFFLFFTPFNYKESQRI